MTALALIPEDAPLRLVDVFAMTAPPCPVTFDWLEVEYQRPGFAGKTQRALQREGTLDREVRWRWEYAHKMMETRK